MMDLKKTPFFLDDEALAWVQSTCMAMSTEEKLGALFCMTGMSTESDELTELVDRWQPGAYMFRAGDPAAIRKAVESMQKHSKVPLLIACNLESGGNGIAENGTFFARPMAVAATGEIEQARRLGHVCAAEGKAVGCNLMYAPVVDIDRNWRNPITNVRSFGSDPETVYAMARGYLDGVAEVGGVCPCIKHFPGDGVDERDQHLLPSVNSLSAEEWEASYGRIYRRMIRDGVKVVMAGHILQPALCRKYDPDIPEKDMAPASSSHTLLTKLLRQDMGFRGLVITDATAMVGYSSLRGRKQALAASVAAGCDMLMFCKNTKEDMDALREGLDKGVFTMQRLDEAVCRQLALKASLGLYKAQPPVAEVADTQTHLAWAAECADKAVTLVKDTEQLLPLSAEKTPRIRLTVLGENVNGGFGDNEHIAAPLKLALEKAGFSVSLYDYSTMEQGEIFTAGVEDMKKKFDLSLVAANVSTGSNNTSRRLDWITLMAADAPWYCRDIPTVFVSFCNPYHLADVPYISTYINAYTASAASVEATVKKLCGQSPFRGQSPVDPFCGLWGADIW